MMELVPMQGKSEYMVCSPKITIDDNCDLFSDAFSKVEGKKKRSILILATSHPTTPQHLTGQFSWNM
jgi:hypothetical protein